MVSRQRASAEGCFQAHRQCSINGACIAITA
jgi:hypothetical protein